jgi:RHS repeat-associated protein
MPIDALREELPGEPSVESNGFFAREAYGALEKQHDHTTGYTHHTARWMAPQLGRWLSPDPLFVLAPEKSFDSPGEANPYGYAANNPAMLTDPSGMVTFIPGETERGNFGAALLEQMRAMVEHGLEYGHPSLADPVAFTFGGLGIRRGDKTDCSTSLLEAFAMATEGDINSIPVADAIFDDIRRDMIIAGDSGRKGIVGAMEQFGIGQEIGSLQDIRAGDIVQGWRSAESGHVFMIDKVHRDDEGVVTGFEMISANKLSRQTATVGGTERNAITMETRQGEGGYNELYIGRFFDVED